jgi:2-methylcitrate dehydratase
MPASYPSRRWTGPCGAKRVHFNNSETLEDEIAVADAHPAGARPFERPQYIGKFDTLTEELIEASERDRFVHLIQGLPELKAEKVREINVQLPSDRIKSFENDRRGIF